MDQCCRFIEEFNKTAVEQYGFKSPYIHSTGLGHGDLCEEVRLYGTLLAVPSPKSGAYEHVDVMFKDSPEFFRADHYSDEDLIEHVMSVFGILRVEAEERLVRADLIKPPVPQEATPDAEGVIGDLCVSLENKELCVELQWIGEGRDGQYDHGDPDDEKRLRFSLLEKCPTGWDPVDAASYCTCLTTKLDLSVAVLIVAHILQECQKARGTGASLKGLCQRLSWVDADDFKAVKA